MIFLAETLGIVTDILADECRLELVLINLKKFNDGKT